MRNLKKIPKIYWLLLLVVVIGGTGIFYNYGVVAGGPDETLKVNQTLKFFRNFSLSDQHSGYLPGVILLEIPFVAVLLVGYLFLGIGNVADLKELVIVDTYKFVPFFRFIEIIFGIITVYLFYKICLQIFNKERPALVASYLLATSLLFIQQIHVAGSWMFQTTMIWISFCYFLTLLKREKWNSFVFVLSALLIVLSAMVELVGFILVIPFFLIFWHKRKKMKINNEIFNLFLFFGVIVFGLCVFVYLNPVAFKDYFSIAKDTSELGFSQTRHGQGLMFRIFGFWQIFLSLESLLFLLFVPGLFIAYKKNKFAFKLFGLTALLYYVGIGPLIGSAIDRRILPMVPIFIIFAVFFIEFLLNRYKDTGFKKLIYVGLLLFMINPISLNNAFLKKGSRIVARDWISSNIPADSLVKDMCWLELNENLEILNEIENNHPEFLTTKRKYLLDNQFLLGQRKNYYVVPRVSFGKEFVAKNKFDYLILCYFDEQERARKLGEFGEFEMTKIYDLTTGYEKFIPLSLFDLNRAYLFSLWKVFSVPYRGPYVQIFRIL